MTLIVAISTNAVYSFGMGLFNQLGHKGTSNECFPVVIPDLMGSKVDQIACGGRHTLSIRCPTGSEDKNTALSWGNNSNGQVREHNTLTSQLGHGDTQSRELPTIVEALRAKNLSNVYAGKMHSIFSVSGWVVFNDGDCTVMYIAFFWLGNEIPKPKERTIHYCAIAVIDRYCYFFLILCSAAI